jgi:hypothetical protein
MRELHAAGREFLRTWWVVRLAVVNPMTDHQSYYHYMRLLQVWSPVAGSIWGPHLSLDTEPFVYEPPLMASIHVPAMMHALLDLPAEYELDLDARIVPSPSVSALQRWPLLHVMSAMGTSSAPPELVIRVAARMSREALAFHLSVPRRYPYDPVQRVCAKSLIFPWLFGFGSNHYHRRILNGPFILALLDPRVARADGSGFDPETSHDPGAPTPTEALEQFVKARASSVGGEEFEPPLVAAAITSDIEKIQVALCAAIDRRIAYRKAVAIALPKALDAVVSIATLRVLIIDYFII